MSTSSSTPHGTALAPYRPPNNDFEDLKLKKLWLALQRRPWRSLAVVAGSKDVSTFDLASTLAKIVWSYRGQSSCVVDYRDLSLRLVEHQLREVAARMDNGQCVIVSLRSILENPSTIAVARAVDTAVLCVRLGETKIAAAEQTVEEIGRENFIGSIVLRDPPGTRR